MLRRALLTLPCGLAVGRVRAAAGGLARLTTLDGSATLVVGAQAQRAAVGRWLPAGTLVDTGSNALLLRIEWPDGSTLDLGPGTQAMLAPPPLPGPAAGSFYLLQGWAKFSARAPGHGWATPLLAAAPATGVAVLSIEPASGAVPGRTVVFAEAGNWALVERPGGQRQALAAGAALRIVPGHSAERLPRAPAEWLPQLPRPFRDTLPPRLAKLPAGEPPVESLPPPRYAELQPWLAAEPALRRGLAQRFGGHLADREFRAAVQANLRHHPEWEPLLAPPRPRKASAAASRGSP